MTIRRLFVTSSLLPMAFVMFAGAGRAFAGTCGTANNNAHGDNRNVAVWIAGWWLHHTYECVQYRGSTGSATGHHTYGGGASGCTSCGRFATATVWSNAPHCIAVQGNLTYGVTGVCHQGTNRALEATPVPYVLNWGGVGGAGTSNALFCTYGCGLWCYGAPC